MSLIRSLRRLQEENKELKAKIEELETKSPPKEKEKNLPNSTHDSTEIVDPPSSSSKTTSSAAEKEKIDRLEKSLAVMTDCYETALEHLALSLASNSPQQPPVTNDL